MWFSTAKTTQFRTPQERSSYVFGIVLLIYLLTIYVLRGYFLYKSTKEFVPAWIAVPFSLIVMQLFQYIYINKGRYDFIKQREAKNPKFKISDKNGMRVAVAFTVSGFFFFVCSVLFVHILNGEIK
jgi:hypothetical protein